MPAQVSTRFGLRTHLSAQASQVARCAELRCRAELPGGWALRRQTTAGSWSGGARAIAWKDTPVSAGTRYPLVANAIIRRPGLRRSQSRQRDRQVGRRGAIGFAATHRQRADFYPLGVGAASADGGARGARCPRAGERGVRGQGRAAWAWLREGSPPRRPVRLLLRSR